MLVTYELLNSSSSSTGTDNTAASSGTTIPPSNNNEEAFIDATPLMEWLDLPQVTLDAMAADAQSPQALAFEWLRHDPHWTLTKEHPIGSARGGQPEDYIHLYYYSPPRARQRMGLATLYYATQGENWKQEEEEEDMNSRDGSAAAASSSLFMSYNHHECDWLPENPSYGCSENLHDPNDDEGNDFLTSLALPSMGLQGTLPPELYLLVSPTTLKRIELSQNRISGTIETYIGVLRDLAHFDVSRNDLTGSVPTEVGSCTDLAILSVNFNARLGGTIPTEVGRLKSLQGLWWRETLVQGAIPSELGLLQRSLSLLDLTGNQLTSTIPVELFVSQFRTEDGTSINTALRRRSANTTNANQGSSGAWKIALEELRLGRNRLTGRIPVAIESVKSSLTALVLSENQFDKTNLPTFLTALTKLTSLQVDSNKWTGKIPSEFGFLSALRSLGLSENQLSGSIPTELCDLTRLQSLYLDGNQNLQGHLGPQNVEGDDHTGLNLTKLSDLRELTISNTSISGFLDPSFCDMAILSFDCDPKNLCGCDCACASVPAPTLSWPITSSPTANPTARPVTAIPSASPTIGATERPTASPTSVVTESITTSLTVAATASPTTTPTVAITQSPSAGPTVGVTQSPTTSPTVVTTESPTNRPTAAPTAVATTPLEELEAAFIELLPEYSQVGLQDPNGAQARALDWLFAGPDVRDYSDERKKQRFALATVHYSMYDTTKVAWLAPETDECANFAQLKIHVTCTMNDESDVHPITDITLDPSGLVGILPPEIALLSSLASLEATQGDLTSTLPTEIGLLQNLANLDLSQNKLQGPLPSELGECAALTSLDVGFNQHMNGTLPTELNNLSHLKALKLASNSFAGRLPQELPSALKVLEVSANLFYGGIPLASWGRSGVGENLERLHLDHNPFQGPLATEIGLFSRLSSLAASTSELTGSIPTEIGLLSQLALFDASWNSLGSSLPSDIGQLTMLRDLNLAGNNFRGSIPTHVGTMARLEELLLHDNDMIGGRIPEELTSLRSLKALTVNKTFVAGRVPSSLCSLDLFHFTCSEWLCGCSWCPCSA